MHRQGSDSLAEVMKPRQVKMVLTNGRPMTVHRAGPHAAKAWRVSLMFDVSLRYDTITNPVLESERPALPKTRSEH